MEKLGDIQTFKERQNIVLEGFDPVSAGGFTQVPNILLNETQLSFAAKVAYAKLLSYAWNNNHVFPGQETMAKHLGCGVSTVSEAISELKEAGWVEVVRRGQGKTNIYKLKFAVRKKRS
jgi:biotin operon repressor